MNGSQSDLFRAIALPLIIALIAGNIGYFVASTNALTREDVRQVTREVIVTENIGAVATEERLKAEITGLRLQLTEVGAKVDQNAIDIGILVSRSSPP